MQETLHCQEVTEQIAEKRFQSLWKGDVFTRLLSERMEKTERFAGGDKFVRGVATRLSWEVDTEWRWDFKRGGWGWCSLEQIQIGPLRELQTGRDIGGSAWECLA